MFETLKKKMSKRNKDKMFKALNPYMLVTLDAMPITDIFPSAIPEKTMVMLDPAREENRDRSELRIAWPEFCRIHFKARINKRERVMTAPDMLIEFLRWILREVGSWKTTPTRPWNPESPVGCWFSPYLRVYGLTELKQALLSDLEMLRAMRGGHG